MNTIKFTLIAGALLATSGVAVAQPGEGRRGPAAEVTREQAVERADRQFARLDADSDGRVTVAEARQGMQGRMERREARRAERRAGRQGERGNRRFERMDTDRNGQISPAELAQHRAQRAERRAQRGERGQRGMRGGNRVEQMLGPDGVITRDEFRARALQRFERLDANRDGRVTVAERREVRQRLRAERRERRQGQN